METHRYTLEQQHDFPCLLFSGSQVKKNILRFFFLFLTCMKLFRLKKKEELDWTFLLKVTMDLVAFTSLLQAVRVNPLCELCYCYGI